MLVACGDDGDGGAAPADGGVVSPSDAGGPGTDATVAADAGQLPDASLSGDAGPRPDAGPGMDASLRNDAGARDGAVGDAARDAAIGAPDAGSSQGGSSAACLACLNTSCVCGATCQEELGVELASSRLAEACGMLPGAARTGPAAGAPLGELCTELVECERASGCAQKSEETIACLCGDLDINTCGGDERAQPNGACVEEIYNAVESDDRMTVFQDIKNPVTAAGVAYQLVTCELAKCADECFAPCAGKPDGTECGRRPPMPTPDGKMDDGKLLCSKGKCPDAPHPLDLYTPATPSSPTTDAGARDAGSPARDAAVPGAGSVDSGSPSGPLPDGGCPNDMSFC